MGDEECNIYFWSRVTNPEYRFLSNFAASPIVIDDKEYATVEHYYQSQKYDDHMYQETVRVAKTAREAKWLGRKWPAREGWDDMKEEVMLRGLRAKFEQNLELKEKLLATGKCSLHEDAPRDMYWGAKGKDRLGKLLMQVREELRASGSS